MDREGRVVPLPDQPWRERAPERGTEVRWARSGRAGTLFLIALLVAAAAIAVLALSEGRGNDAGLAPPGSRGGPTAGPEDSGSGIRTSSETDAPPGTRTTDGGEGSSAGGMELRQGPRTESADDPRFDGEGTLRGYVEVVGDVPFPKEWTLVLAPSRVLTGREAAEERTLVFDDGSQEFTVSGLHLGGYDVHAEAVNMNGRKMSLLLEVRSPDAFVVLQMLPAAALDGRVVDHEGTVAGGVPITLIELPDRIERVSATDPSGAFRFEDVLVGSYELWLGTVESPIVRAHTTLRMNADGITLPPIELPPLATLTLVVADDADERLIPEALLRGSRVPSGTFEGRTDAWGELVARWLPPGRWRVRVEAEGYGGKRGTLDLAPGDEQTVTFRLVR